MPLISYILFTIISFFCFTVSQAQEVIVVDGDTIKIDGEKIRFTGIDAPELNQTCLTNDSEIACGKLSQMLLIMRQRIILLQLELTLLFHYFLFEFSKIQHRI